MGCFFHCIGFRSNGEGRRNRRFPSAIACTRKASLVARRQLGSLFLNDGANLTLDFHASFSDHMVHRSDHSRIASPPEQQASSIPKDSFGADSLFRELKREAKFLKACGAILETPAEIRKVSGIPTQDPREDGRSSNYITRFRGSSCKKKLWDEDHELARCPVRVQEDDGTSQDNHGSCTFKAHQTPQDCECSPLSVNLSRSGAFEGIQDQSSIERMDNDAPVSSSQPKIQSFSSECSPFPTPLGVTADMETPATFCHANLEHFRTGKNTRIPTQYVYPVHNPVENQWKVLNEDSSEPVQLYDIFDQQTNHSPHAREKMQDVSRTSEPENSELSGTSKLTSSSNKRRQQDEVVYTDKSTNTKDEKLASPKTSLSEWLKPPIYKDGLSNEIFEKPHSAKSADVDRPILGMVAAHWKDEDPESRSSKRWDGNGIPNSTNKYKEDQKVSWHATPFEERLDKALSDENFFSQRKFPHSKPMQLENEGELSDTAAS
ncbi:protein JASON-like isoform X1 [Canna indica]|uniref:Protein JASON-like isoform X1 n=1 Tax=Canna indica TaxID=4628 RepID=A0AAQ3QJT8_9LILI|nr:protein JASON-like isoform X1 [Canna indica]